MRLLIITPTWLGDAVMATPALRVLRSRLRAAFIGALVRPGIDQLFAGTDFFDEIHIDPRAGVMGPKHAAQKVRARNYDAAILLSNSFSAALTARLAFIPRRVGYARDARSLLLTETIAPARRCDTEPFSRSDTAPNDWAPVPACDYYMNLARRFLGDESIPLGPLELATTPEEEAAADDILARADLERRALRAAILNPGGNNPAKRWPPERFAAAAHHLMSAHGLDILLNGSPAEADLVESIASRIREMGEAGGKRIVELPKLGMTIGALKAIIRRCRIMLTNDTGPRHVAAAFKVPVVTLFGPTDRRWTTIPFDREIELVADPDLPEEEVANDHPDRCRVDRIEVASVTAALDRLLA